MSKRVPSYRLHKPSGLAVVTINGKDNYIGPFGSVESHEAYGRLIANHSSGAPEVARTVPVANAGFTVNEIVLAFVRHAEIVSLESLESLLEGRTDAVELPGRSAVPQKNIDAVRQKVNERTRDMIVLCLLVGCRPGELVSLTSAMIDCRGDVWNATLLDHKMKHKNKVRMLAFLAPPSRIRWCLVVLENAKDPGASIERQGPREFIASVNRNFGRAWSGDSRGSCSDWRNDR